MLMVQLNPFIIEGYLSPEYFCDRVEETALLTRHLTNRCNVALIAPRRLGKSGLIYNCFQQENIREQYHCIYIDIYDTKNLNEFVYALGKGILTALKPKGRQGGRIKMRSPPKVLTGNFRPSQLSFFLS